MKAKAKTILKIVTLAVGVGLLQAGVVIVDVLLCRGFFG